jgi:hypothetical protein
MGREVIWIGGVEWLDDQGFRYRTEPVTLNSQRLEGSYDHKPQAIVEQDVTLMLNYLESDSDE